MSAPWGGNGGYTYTWTGGAAPVANPQNLAAGTYDLIVTDQLGCTIDTSITLTTPDGPVLDGISAVDVGCFGESTGSIDLQVSGGQAPYVFDWTGTAYDGQEDPSGVPAGTYDVTITDANNCSAVSSITVDEPAELTTTTTTTDVLCSGESSGSATALPSGGVGGYTYLWCDGQTSDVATNLPAGPCALTITDGNGCELIASVTVSEPPVLTASLASITPADCNAQSTGSIEITAAGGVGGYTYAWTGGAAPTSNPQNLPAGVYDVTVMDSNGCVEVLTGLEVSEPDPITFSYTSTDATCNMNNGDIELTVMGGNGGYTYAWTGGADPVANPQNLAAGDYEVTITDLLGCTTVGMITVATPTALAVQSVSTTDATCFGQADGSISVVISGGSPGYSYAWSGGLDPVANPTGVAAGTYDVDITDMDGCVISTSATVDEPPIIDISVISVSPATCNQDNGSIDIEVQGGVPPYTYLWSNGDMNQDPSGLSSGQAQVIVTDGNGCTAMADTSVAAPGALNVVEQVNGVSCFSATDGSIILNASGGNGPYTYIWSIPGVGDTNVASNLGGGMYSVIVEDADGCRFTIPNIEVPEPDLLVQSSIIATDASCLANDGSIEVDFTGGTGAYTYSWTSSTGFTSSAEDISGLEPGVYTLLVTDENNCTTTVQGTIDVPTPPTASATPTDVLCNGDASGSIEVLVSGANGGVMYQWNDGSIGNTDNPQNLPAGSYEVTVVDDEFCQAIAMATISEPPVLDAFTIGAEVSCHGGDDGSAVVTASGGTPGYTYLWSNGATTADPSGLTPDTYTVTVTDANGCTDVATVQITEPPLLELQAATTDTRCANESSGSIDVTAQGGDGNYTYDWTDDQYDGQSQLTDLAAGTYTVVVTDGKGCTETITAEVMAPPAVEVSVTDLTDYAGFNVSCANLSDGAATVEGVGGNGGPFSYEWDDGSTSSSLEELSAGEYGVTVTDQLGCTEEERITLTAPEAIVLSVEGSTVSCFGEDDGAIVINDVQGGAAPYVYSLDGAPFGDPVFTGLEAGNYELIVQDANGCEEKMVITINQPTELAVDLGGDEEIQLGDSVYLQANHTAGQVDTLYWVLGVEELDCPNCPAQWVQPTYTTTYSVFIQDEQGCVAEDEIVVRVIKDRLIYIPTAFSPGEGVNNIFLIYGGRGVEQVKSFVIADRWGRDRVFQYQLPAQ